MAITPNGRFAYISANGHNTLYVIDTSTNTIAATVNMNYPNGVAITSNGAFAYVSGDGGTNTFVVVDTSTNTVVATGPDGGITPIGVAMSSDEAFAYIANRDSNNVSIISTSTNTVIGTIAVGLRPFTIATIMGIGPPTDTEQCKKGGWQRFTIPRKFKNQGDCVSFVNNGK